MIHSYIDDTVKEHVPLVLAGFPGSGKSALIAYTVKQCLTNKKYKVIIISVERMRGELKFGDTMSFSNLSRGRIYYWSDTNSTGLGPQDQRQFRHLLTYMTVASTSIIFTMMCKQNRHNYR